MEVDNLEEQNRNLTQSSQKQVDILYRARRVDNDQEILLHIEILADARPDFALKMLQYRTMLLSKYGEDYEIYQFVLYVGNGPMRIASRLTQTRGLDFWFEAEDIRKMDPELFLGTSSLDFQLLGFLASTENAETVGKELVERIVAETSEEVEIMVTRLEILELFSILREQKTISRMIRNILLRDQFRKYSKYSSTYQIGKEEGIQIGKEKGIQIGAEQGRLVEKWSLAQKLHLLGESLEKIALLTDLSLEDLEARWARGKNTQKKRE